MLTRTSTITTAIVAAIVIAIFWASGAFGADLRPSYSVTNQVKTDRAPTWTGFYLGAQGGYAWGRVDATGTPIGTSTDGWLAGARMGFDYQIPGTRWVAGLLGEASFADIGGTARFAGMSIPAETDLIGSLRARFGYAFDGFLLYGTGGLSAAKYDIRVSGTPFSGEATQWSWIVGAGVETKLTADWSIGAEYLYRGRASETICLTALACAPFKADSQTALVYLNRRW